MSQSSYQNPAFDSRRAVNRRQEVVRASVHVAIVALWADILEYGAATNREKC